MILLSESIWKQTLFKNYLLHLITDGKATPQNFFLAKKKKKFIHTYQKWVSTHPLLFKSGQIKRRCNSHLTSPEINRHHIPQCHWAAAIAAATWRSPASGCQSPHGHWGHPWACSMQVFGVMQPGFNGSIFQWVSLEEMINKVCLVDRNAVFTFHLN